MFRSTKGASKQRRDLINAEIAVLRDLLPLPEATRQRLSQLQIMSLACVYIRKCNSFSRLFGDGKSADGIDCEFSQAMTGFLLATSRDGKLLYISENVMEYLGHSMVDMMTQGDSIYDIIDKRDHQLVQRQLMQDNVTLEGGTGLDVLSRNERSFFCRMNVARSFRRQTGFGDHKMMYVSGHFVTPSIRDLYGNQPVFIAVCTPLITPDVKETTIQNSTQTFYSVHGLDMKYSELGHIGQYHLGYTEAEIADKSWYELLHPEDILEAKEKHIQLIKSSHEMGCVLTARLQHKEGHWVWMNIVMHIRQPFVCDNDEPAIVCINQVINESEAQQFKIQSQMYSSQIARSPEFLGSRDTSVPHTITQVPVERGAFAGRGCAAGQRNREDVTYQVNFVAAGTQAVSPRSEQLQGVGSNIFTDSGSDYSNSSSSESDTKQAIRADIINRLKRKMSESLGNCKPKKIQRINDSNGRTSSGSGLVGLRPASLVSDVSSLNGVDGGLAIGNRSVQVLARSQEAPIYQQLALKKELVLNQQDSLANMERTIPLFRETVKPPTPLTPDSLTSDLTTEFQTNLLQMDVVESAVVPPSVLTPDASPISVTTDEVSNSPPPHVDPSLEYSAELPSLDDLCFFEDSNPSKATKTKLPVILQLPDASNKHLPVIDAGSLETMLCDLIDDATRDQAGCDAASITSPSPSIPEPQQQQNPVQQQPQQVMLSENDEQLLNQVTNVLIEMVQQAADGSLDLSQLMMASQQQQQQQQAAGSSLSTAATISTTSVPSVKINDSLAEVDGLTQLSSAAAISDEMNFTLDDISHLTQLDIATPSFGDCDLTSSLLAQNL